jgi:3-hydroxyisobutyrate dehydrogenase-like beta-hydroxyacid dehydrogenase
MKQPVGFIGLGLMGKAMALRLLGEGFPLFVHTRTKQKAEPVLQAGAMWCDTPAAVAEKTDLVLSMISDSKALETIALGSGGVLQTLKRDGVHVDLSTVSPSLTEQLFERYKAKGCAFLHSPVLGSVPNAADGSLLLFVGGIEGGFERAQSVLHSLGKHLWRFETPSQASTMKLICNSFIASMIVTLAQGIVYARAARIEPTVLLEVLAQSALNSPMYQTKGKAMIEENFVPRFFVEHMLKDVELGLESARQIGVVMPMLEVAQKLFQKSIVEGHAKDDYSAVIKVLESGTTS